jgi:DNA-binding XRE family transcriptional regulator
VKNRKILDEAQLSALAKQYREAAGKTQGQAARELRVSRPAIVQAETQPRKSFFKLRKKMIDHYSPFRVVGPMYLLEKK